MSTTYTPQNQRLHNTPYSQILLHENIQDSKVYISRNVNQLLKSIGDDLVLKGLELTKEPEISNYTVTFTLSPGLIIQNSTLIEIKDDLVEDITLSINTSAYDQNNGYLIIYTDFHTLETVAENYLTLKVAYAKADGSGVLGSTPWNSTRNRIILYRFSFIKSSSALLSVTEENADFELVSHTYNLRGNTNFTNYAFRLVYDHASETDHYGLATDTKYGHVKVPLNSNILLDNGAISVPEATTVVKGVTKLATEDEALLMEATDKALTPSSIKHIILNLKDIEIQVVDPGITLGTALILS